MHSIEPSALTCLASRDVTRVFRVVGTKTAQRTAIDIPVCAIPRPIRAAASVPRIHTLESLRPHTRGGQHPDDGRVRHPFGHVRRRRRDFTPGGRSEFTVGEESKDRHFRKGFSKDPGVHVLLAVELLASTDANHGESAERRIVRRSARAASASGRISSSRRGRSRTNDGSRRARLHLRSPWPILRGRCCRDRCESFA